MANKEYLHQDIETGLMEGVQGVQQGPATPGQPVEVSATGFIDASLLPTNYDPSIPVTAAEDIPAGALCYYTVIGGIAYLHRALGTTQATVATCFTKQAIGQGATGAAYIYGTAKIPNLGFYDTSEVGQSLYLSSSLPGSPTLTAPVTPNQWIQHVGSIVSVDQTFLTFFFTGIFDNGHAVGTTAQGQLDPATLALLVAHLHDTANPHAVTCAQIGAIPAASLGQPGGPIVSDLNGNLPEALQTTSLWSRKAIRVVARTNVALNNPSAAIDGVTMNVGDRVLLVGQTAPTQNGVYTWTAYNQPLTRATDAATGSGLWAAIYVVVNGTSAGEVWMNTNVTLPVADSSPLTYKLLAGMALNFMTNPITTTGDLLIGDLQGNPGRLPVGPSYAVLTMVGGVPAWAQPAPQLPGYSHVNDGQILAVINGGLGWVAPPSGGTTLPGYGNAQNGEVLGVVNSNLAWVTAFVNPMLVAGDMLVAQAGGQPQRLAIGSTGQILAVVSGVPTWVNAPNPLPAWSASNNGQVLTVISGIPTWAVNTGGMTNPMIAAGDMILGGGGGMASRLAPGAAGTVLSMVGGTPQWQVPAPQLPAYDSTNNGQVLAIHYDIPTWMTFTTMTNPMTEAGDLITSTANGLPARVGPGTNGQVLSMVSGTPGWVNAPLGIPAYSATNNGQVLTVIGGAPTWVAGFTNPMTGVGDILVGAATGTPQRLAPGTNGYVLTMVGGTPAWAQSGVGLPTWSSSNNGQILSVVAGNPAWTNGLTNPMTSTGDMMIAGSGGTVTRLASGPNGYVLTMVSGSPAWASAPISLPVYSALNNGMVLCVQNGTASWGAPASGLPDSTSANAGNVLVCVGAVPTWMPNPSLTNPLTTLYDLMVGGPGGVPARLPVGATKGTVLGVQADGTLGYFNPISGDPYISDVTMLLTGAETGSGTVTDATGRSWALNGTPQVPPASPHNGLTSVFSFDGISQSITGSANDQGFNLTGDFTIEFSMYNPNPARGGQIMGLDNYGITPEWTIFGDNGAGGEGVKLTTNQGTVVTAAFPTAGQWVDVAFVRKGTAFYIFANGTLINNVTWGGALSFPSGVPLCLGSHGNRMAGGAGVWWTGQLANIRITNGFARYTSTYNVPQSFPTTSGIGLTNPMTLSGDLLVGAGGGAPARLPIGATGQILTVVGGVPAWAAPTAQTNPLSAAGDIVVAGAGGVQGRLAIGNNGTVLTVVGGTPAWVTPTANMVNPMTTTGDLIVAAANGAPARLQAGSNGMILTVVNGVPAWATPSASSGTTGSSFSYYDPDMPALSPTAQDDEFNGTVLDPKWTTVNWGSVVATDVNTTVPGSLYVHGTSLGRTIPAALQPLPAGDFTIWTKVSVTGRDTGDTAIGLILTDGATAGAGTQLINVTAINGVTQSYVAVSYWTGFNAISTGVSTNYGDDMKYLRFRRAGTVYYTGWSTDGKTWTEGAPITLAFTPAYMGLTWSVYSTSGTSTSAEFFRYQPSATALLGGTRVVSSLPTYAPLNNGQVLTMVAGVPTWSAPTVQGDSFTYFDPEKPCDPPTAQDDEFTGAVLDPKWTQVNWGSNVSAYDLGLTVPGALCIKSTVSTGATISGLLQPLPAGDFTVWGKIRVLTSGGNCRYALLLSSSNVTGTGSQYLVSCNYNGGFESDAYAWSNFNAYGSGQALTGLGPYYRMRRVGSSYYMATSIDGLYWTEVTMPIGFTPAFFGLSTCNNNGTVVAGSFEFIRYQPSGTAILGGTRKVGTSGLPSTSSVNNGQILSVVGGVPTWAATVAPASQAVLQDLTTYSAGGTTTSQCGANSIQFGQGMVVAGATLTPTVIGSTVKVTARVRAALDNGYNNFVAGIFKNGALAPVASSFENQQQGGWPVETTVQFTMVTTDHNPIVFQLRAASATSGNLTIYPDSFLEVVETGFATSVLLGDNFNFWDPDKPSVIDSGYDDDFSSSALAAAWTPVNQGTLTSYDVNTTVPGALYVQANNMGRNIAAWMRPLPPGDFTLVTKVATSSALSGTTDNGLGLILSDGVTVGSGSQVVLSASQWSAQEESVYTIGWTGFNTIGGSTGYISRGTKYLRLRRANATYYAGWSSDGKTWAETILVPGITPAYMGLFVQCYQSGRTDNSFEFFRYFPSATAKVGGLRWVGTTGLPMSSSSNNNQVLTVLNGVPTWAAPTTGGLANPMTTLGDMLLGAAGGAPARLAPGFNGQLLTMVSGSPAWATFTALTNPMTTPGDLIVGGSAGVASRLALGSNGQVLTVVNGALGWAAPGGGGGGGTDILTPLLTASTGAMLYGWFNGSTVVPQTLWPGGNGTILTIVNGVPTWTGGAVPTFTHTTDNLGKVLTITSSGGSEPFYQYQWESPAPGLPDSTSAPNGAFLTLVSGVPSWAAGAFVTGWDNTGGGNWAGEVLTLEWYTQGDAAPVLVPVWDSYYALPDPSGQPQGVLACQNGSAFWSQGQPVPSGGGGNAFLMTDGNNNLSWDWPSNYIQFPPFPQINGGVYPWYLSNFSNITVGNFYIEYGTTIYGQSEQTGQRVDNRGSGSIGNRFSAAMASDLNPNYSWAPDPDNPDNWLYSPGPLDFTSLGFLPISLPPGLNVGLYISDPGLHYLEFCAGLVNGSLILKLNSYAGPRDADPTNIGTYTVGWTSMPFFMGIFRAFWGQLYFIYSTDNTNWDIAFEINPNDYLSLGNPTDTGGMTGVGMGAEAGADGLYGAYNAVHFYRQSCAQNGWYPVQPPG